MITTKILHNNEVVEGKIEDLGAKHTTVWVDVTDPEPPELESVANHIGANREDLSDLLQPDQRPILHDIGKFTAVVFHVPEVQKNSIAIKPHLLLASKQEEDFITLHQGLSLATQKIQAYPPRRQIEIFQKGSTALLFVTLSEMVANGFEVLDYVSEEISKIEEQMFETKLSSNIVKRIFNLKKNLIYFQRTLASDREVVSEIEKAYGKFLDHKQLSKFRLLYSDVTQLIELSATYRDIIISAIEVHLSAISNNLNVIVKKLTAWAAIILVPSLIAGIYGMNFSFLPIAHNPAGFWFALALMLFSVGLLYSYFKHNDWV